MRNKILNLSILAMVFLLTSCGGGKNIAYFQNKIINDPQDVDHHAGIVIEPKDMLSIIVSGRNPELVVMFNLPVVTYQAGSETTSAGNRTLVGYVVDNNGFIDFPVLGKINVKGQTRWELSEHIAKMLADGGYITDAVVSVEFMNFKVSVLGEVNSPGTYTIQGDKVTLLQAISLARDLTIFGQRENVTVIREKEGERVMYEVNLCDVSMFNSPAYYLQQNDIVYAEPNEMRKRQTTINGNSALSVSFWISVASLITTAVTTVGVFVK